jgi:hypothetical protein
MQRGSTTVASRSVNESGSVCECGETLVHCCFVLELEVAADGICNDKEGEFEDD